MTSIPSRSAKAALVGLAALVGAQVCPAMAAEPFGTWLTEDGRARVRTERCGADPTRLCGYIVWGAKPNDGNGKPKVDRDNPDPKKRGRPLLGHQMLLGLKPDGEGAYEGRIYNGEDGKSYDVTVWSEKPSELSVKGCMLIFCGTQAWTRVADAAPGQLQGPTDGPNGPRSDPEWAGRPAATGTVPKSDKAGDKPERPK